MANVEQRAEAEASAKGLSGQARKSYIGGVFNRIRQAHDKAVTPSARGRKLFNRRERVQARLDARLAMQPHREAIDVLRRQRNERIAAHQDEPRESSAQLTQRILHSDLKPVRHVEGLNIGAEMAAGPNPTHLRDIYGQEQLPKALDLFPTPSLRKAARERGMPAGGSRHDVIARLAQPAKPPKLPAPERQRQRAIADAIKHGAPDFPPGTLAAAQGKPAKAAPKIPRFDRKPLVPIKEKPIGFQLDATRDLDPYFIREYFGDKQLPKALGIQPANNLAEAVGVVERKTGKHYSGARSDRPAMYHWILANMGGGQPEKPAAQPRMSRAERRAHDLEIMAAAQRGEKLPALSTPRAPSQRELDFQRKHQFKHEQGERDRQRKADQEARFQRNLELKRHGFQWSKVPDIGGPSDNGDTVDMVWQLYDAEGKPVSEAEAFRRIRQK